MRSNIPGRAASCSAAGATDDRLRIEVHDTGPGMTAEDFARARGRAVRLAADASAPQGHGLGLSIACSLARDHGLSLSIVPERKSGTSVLLTVPLAPDAA